MIALRGHLERITHSRGQTKPATITTPTEANSPVPDENTSAQQSAAPVGSFWKWSGLWAFSSSISEADVAHFKATALTAGSSTDKQVTSSKQLFPFSYTWEAAVDPFDVRVPSEEIAFKLAQERLKESEKMYSEDMVAVGSDSIAQTTESTSGIIRSTAAAQRRSSTSASSPGAAVYDRGEKSGVESGVAVGGATASPTSESFPVVSKTEGADGKTETPTVDPAAANTEGTVGSSAIAPANIRSTERLEIASLPPVSTFADDGFTDACRKFTNQCPPGGRWKGFFHTATQTTSTRKPLPIHQQTIPISESFALFLNATPQPSARIQFVDDAENSIPSAKLPSGHVHARGMGENQFGIFELTGSLDLESGILQLQRLYVQTPESLAARASQRRSPRGRRRGGRMSVDGDSQSARGTRKRSLTWKRRSMIEGEEYGVVSGKGKRQRKHAGPVFAVGGSIISTGEGQVPVEGPSGTTMAERVGLQVVEGAQQIAEKQEALGPSLEMETAASAAATSTTTPTVKQKWPAAPINIPGKNEGVRRTSSSTSTSKKGPAPNGAAASLTAVRSSGVSSSVLNLPPAGDPTKARWRAAHFLYYHRPSATEETAATISGANMSSNNNNNATISVVYEGELFNGKRHGRGVCLYDNNLIYEGEWRHDKEHGYGTLFSGDRKRIFYEGEWERGRIQGVGKYYYDDEQQQPPTAEESRSGKKKKPSPSSTYGKGVPLRSRSMYEGEFREGLRHGKGIYVLPDGSVYEGGWANGSMNGRGVFRWTDGSVYDGDWKDGRRHGQGFLRVSDGFTYDGNWVQNCMEGRASATYPSGQEYHGMFSNGKREGRGTIKFSNGAVYEGRFRDDAVDGQGTMKIRHAVVVPSEKEEEKPDFMIPVSFQSDMGHIHRKAGFTIGGN